MACRDQALHTDEVPSLGQETSPASTSKPGSPAATRFQAVVPLPSLPGQPTKAAPFRYTPKLSKYEQDAMKRAHELHKQSLTKTQVMAYDTCCMHPHLNALVP